MTESNYQKPPLREEIEKFFKELKNFALITIKIALGVASIVGIILFCISKTGLQILNYVYNHSPQFLFTTIITTSSCIVLYYAIKDRYFIYKRYRIGYFSEMMWCFITFPFIQLLNIPIYLYMDGLIPIITTELIAITLTISFVLSFKKERPQLTRPLTEEENKLRKKLISRITYYYRYDHNNTKSYHHLTIKEHVSMFARSCYIMDFYPELIKEYNETESHIELLNKLCDDPHIDVEDTHYKKYYNRALLRLKQEVTPLTPDLEDYFE